MDLIELIDKFRIQTKDRSLPYMWEDPEVISWFNEAQSEAALRARLLFDKTSSFCTIAVTVAGGNIYDLSPLINEIEYAYLVDTSGNRYKLRPTDRIQLEDMNPKWREYTGIPEWFIQSDTQIEIAGVIQQDFTLKLEVYRDPLQNIEDTRTDTPEIASHHHKHLIKWALHRAYLVNDSDKYAAKLSKQYLDEFEAYFGLRPGALRRIKEQQNRPQGNKVCY
jgi:hypothetical protein